MTGQLNIKIGDKEISLNLTGIDEAAQKGIIESSVAAFMKTLEKPRPIRTYKLKERAQPVTYPEAEERMIVSDPPPVVYEVETRALEALKKNPPATEKDQSAANGDEKKLSVPIGEKIARLQGFEQTYQAYYICTNKRCKNRGKHYITKSYIEIHCHKCSTKMKVKKAVDGPGFKPDGFGNYFVAGDFVRVVDFSKLEETEERETVSQK